MQNVIIDCNKSTIKNSVLSLVILQNIFTYTRGISEFLIKFSTWTGHQILIENDKFNLAEKILQDPLISWLSQIEIILADSNQLWKLLINFLISAGLTKSDMRGQRRILNCCLEDKRGMKIQFWQWKCSTSRLYQGICNEKCDNFGD